MHRAAAILQLAIRKATQGFSLKLYTVLSAKFAARPNVAYANTSSAVPNTQRSAVSVVLQTIHAQFMLRGQV
jgi:hypothetical protein